MTREEIILLAREAGFSGLLPSEHVEGTGDVWAPDENITGEMERFAHLIAAFERETMRQDGWRRCAEGQGETQHCALLEAAVLAEREACAKICDGNANIWDDDLGYWGLAYSASAKSSAAKIRARGQE